MGRKGGGDDEIFESTEAAEGGASASVRGSECSHTTRKRVSLGLWHFSSEEPGCDEAATETVMRSRSGEKPSELGAAAATETSMATSASRDRADLMLLIKHKALWVVDGYAPFARSRCQRFENSDRFKGRGFREVDALLFLKKTLGKSSVPRVRRR